VPPPESGIEAGEDLKRVLIALLKWTAVALVLGFTLLYAGDYLLIRHKMANQANGNAFGTVKFYYGTPLKNGRVQIFVEQPETEVCIHSLFPHFGYHPCWYASREEIRMISRAGQRPKAPQPEGNTADFLQSDPTYSPFSRSGQYPDRAGQARQLPELPQRLSADSSCVPPRWMTPTDP